MKSFVRVYGLISVWVEQFEALKDTNNTKRWELSLGRASKQGRGDGGEYRRYIIVSLPEVGLRS